MGVAELARGGHLAAGAVVGGDHLDPGWTGSLQQCPPRPPPVCRRPPPLDLVHSLVGRRRGPAGRQAVSTLQETALGCGWVAGAASRGSFGPRRLTVCRARSRCTDSATTRTRTRTRTTRTRTRRRRRRRRRRIAADVAARAAAGALQMEVGGGS